MKSLGKFQPSLRDLGGTFGVNPAINRRAIIDRASGAHGIGSAQAHAFRPVRVYAIPRVQAHAFDWTQADTFPAVRAHSIAEVQPIVL